MRPRLSDSIIAARSQKKLAFLPFLAGGYPDIATFIQTLKSLALVGADCVEIGFPFSDPIADGPTIQEAFAHSLRNGITTADVFSAVREARQSVDTPLVAMVSFSIVFRSGPDRFVANAKDAGFDGILIPDLPPPEGQAVCENIRAADLDTVLLVAPTTSPARRKQIAELCSGFVYYLSVSGITGERDSGTNCRRTSLRTLRTSNLSPTCRFAWDLGYRSQSTCVSLSEWRTGQSLGRQSSNGSRRTLGNRPKTPRRGSANTARNCFRACGS
jgi:tryptophan synthase alpha chain